MSTAPPLSATGPPVDLDAPVDTVARPATVLAETTPLPEAWARLHEDQLRCGVVVRDGLPIAVVTAGGLAERWPAGGPLVQHRRTLRELLDRPCGSRCSTRTTRCATPGTACWPPACPPCPCVPSAAGPCGW